MGQASLLLRTACGRSVVFSCAIRVNRWNMGKAPMAAAIRSHGVVLDEEETMPFYTSEGLEGRSVIDQDEHGNCYIIAAVAAAQLTGREVDCAAVKHKVGYGLGGTPDRAFKAMGLYGVNKNELYRGSWRNLIMTAVGHKFPACL